jgi:hypothetical protein
MDDNNTIIINLDNTYGATTSYINSSGSSIGIIAQEIGSIDSSYTISVDNTVSTLDTITLTGLDGMWWNDKEKTHIEIAEIEKMCVEYPALAKVYENFKTVYDLVKQDWKGKKDANENS